jgi:hypothetical protein
MEKVQFVPEGRRTTPHKVGVARERDPLTHWFCRLILIAGRGWDQPRLITRPKQLPCIVVDDAVPNEEAALDNRGNDS